MSILIEEAIERMKRDRELRWKEGLLKFYRVSRRKLVKVGISFLLIYLLLFQIPQTPLFWFFASPLKISQTPQKADAIVVFGGGVGEGGRPGESTIERARYAAELYRDGYATHLILSSGYIYKYNDAENMQFIAHAAGVPNEHIFLEQKANSTYENGKLTKQILDKYKWDSILLVSSPYNMRRVKLVFGKIDKNLNVIYTPVNDPQFYVRHKRVKGEQIRAVVHEYLGIIYYWWKGWI